MYFIKTHVAEAGGVIETEYFETFFSEFLNDSRQLVASSSLVLENIIGTSTPIVGNTETLGKKTDEKTKFTVYQGNIDSVYITRGITLRLSENKLMGKQDLLFTEGILIKGT